MSRLLGLLAIAWCLGFAAFMLTLARPLEGTTTDAIAVPTGAPGRIERGLDLLARHQARRMLVTGVAPGVRAADLQRSTGASPALFGCCVDLGGEAVDTRSNAEEIARWVRARNYHSVRLVTSDWHMARARMELRALLGPDVAVVGDGVPGPARLGTLVNEYDKLLLRWALLKAGWRR